MSISYCTVLKNPPIGVFRYGSCTGFIEMRNTMAMTPIVFGHAGVSVQPLLRKVKSIFVLINLNPATKDNLLTAYDLKKKMC